MRRGSVENGAAQRSVAFSTEYCESEATEKENAEKN